MINFSGFLLAFLCGSVYSDRKIPKVDISNSDADVRSRDHFKHTISLDKFPEFSNAALTHETLQKLHDIYINTVKPLEDAYSFNDMKDHIMNEGELFSLPLILFLGPWSTGKSTLINYILGIENTSLALKSGAHPTTSDFSILSYRAEPKTIEGKTLVMDKVYSSLLKYGQNFLERLKNYGIPNDLLSMVNLVDTPGVVENRKQQDRGYPFEGVCGWFMERADLIVFVFDPAKLDVGRELEQLFRKVKGSEAKVRIVLNKADIVRSQELLRVYGSLFWNLSPLLNIADAPKVYVSSFWSRPFRDTSPEFADAFVRDEISLLDDIRDVMSRRLQNKIAFLRQHAMIVRNHALMVDRYLATLSQHRSFFQSAGDVIDSITERPEEYRIYQKVSAHRDVTQGDLFPPGAYRDFFVVHPMEGFLSLSKHCGFLTPCLLEAVERTLYEDLPHLSVEVESKQSLMCSRTQTCGRAPEF